MKLMQDPLTTELFSKQLEFLKSSQGWSKEKVKRYQLDQLKDLLDYCQREIPYYEALFHKEKIDVNDIHQLSDLKRIPFLTKADIQSQYEAFIPKSSDIHSLMHRSTGGSTGTPLTVYYDMDFLSKDKANTIYYMDVIGYDPFNFKSLRIYGDKVPDEVISRGEFWYERDNKLIMSCYHFSQENFPKYIQAIIDFNPDYIHSRSSALFPLADYIVSKGLKLDINVGAVFLDGEFLTQAQRERMESAFGSKVYNIFGHTEGCAVGVACKESDLMHFMPQVGILELLDEDGSEVKEEGRAGELVVTGFNNRMFPLIRYRTFDIGVHTNEKCGCNRNYKMLKGIDGRLQDFVVNKEGDLVPLAPAVFNYNDMDWKGIRQFQVYQDSEGKLTFRIVRESEVIESEENMSERILSAFNKIFNGMFEIDIQYVQDIPRTKIGKFRYLDQQLDLSRFQLVNK